MFPPKVKKSGAQVPDGRIQYLSDAKKTELWDLKRQLDSRHPTVLIKQLYAETQAATLRALAASQKPSPVPPSRETPKGRLTNYRTKAAVDKDFTASFEATTARVLANEQAHTTGYRAKDAKVHDENSKAGQTPLKKMHTAELLEEFKGIDWANISAYKAYEFGLALQRDQAEAREKQQALLRDLNKQIDEHEYVFRAGSGKNGPAGDEAVQNFCVTQLRLIDE